MKKYVFEECRGKFRLNQIIDTLEEAMWYSGEVWHSLPDDVKQKYYDSENDCFEIYEIDITEEQLEEYETAVHENDFRFLKFDLRDLEVRIVWDYLKRYAVYDDAIDDIYGNTETEVVEEMQENGWKLDEVFRCADRIEFRLREVMKSFYEI